MQAAIFVPIVFFMVQYTITAEKFFLFFIMFLQSISLYTFFGQMLVYVVPIPALAAVMAAGKLFSFGNVHQIQLMSHKIL